MVKRGNKAIAQVVSELEKQGGGLDQIVEGGSAASGMGILVRICGKRRVIKVNKKRTSSFLTMRTYKDEPISMPIAPSKSVDFKIKTLTVSGKRLKLTIWDTVYDVTRRETFTNLSDVWAKEVELYSNNQDCVKMLVGNKVDRESERAVTREEGIALAKELGGLFLECSAKTRQNVQNCFEELALKVNDTFMTSL
ncbi:Ras-related protein RABC1 [Capsicum chinense]|nr:Ras-related protein RABC1 [Capsicum chinense]